MLAQLNGQVGCRLSNGRCGWKSEVEKKVGAGANLPVSGSLGGVYRTHVSDMKTATMNEWMNKVSY